MLLAVDVKKRRQLIGNIEQMVVDIVEIAEMLFLIVSDVELRRDDIEKKERQRERDFVPKGVLKVELLKREIPLHQKLKQNHSISTN
jgi:hypothetical protein